MTSHNGAARGPRGQGPHSVPPDPDDDDDALPTHDVNHDPDEFHTHDHEPLDEVDERELGGEG